MAIKFTYVNDFVLYTIIKSIKYSKRVSSIWYGGSVRNFFSQYRGCIWGERKILWPDPQRRTARGAPWGGHESDAVRWPREGRCEMAAAGPPAASHAVLTRRSCWRSFYLALILLSGQLYIQTTFAYQCTCAYRSTSSGNSSWSCNSG